MTEMTGDVSTRLEQVDLFAGMSRRHMKALARKSKETDHHIGHEIASEGRGALAFHMILSGTASVRRGDREVRTLGPGDYFGEISMIDGKPRSATVVATDRLRTLAITRSSFLQLLEDEPSVAEHIMKQLCARIREAEAVTT